MFGGTINLLAAGDIVIQRPPAAGDHIFAIHRSDPNGDRCRHCLTRGRYRCSQDRRSVYQGDVIETGADGAIGIIFNDGTTFNLSSNAHMVLDEFVCEANGIAPSALFRLARGVFSFLAGKVADRQSTINTPVARFRGTARSGGTGIVTLAAFIFSIIREIHADTEQPAWVDRLHIPYALLDHGKYDVTTLDGQVYVVGDPGQTIVVRREGSSYSAEYVANTPTQMAAYQAAYQAAFAIFSGGQNDGPQLTRASGSGGPFDPTTVNLFTPVGTIEFPPGNTGSNNLGGPPPPPGNPGDIAITLPAIIQVLPISHDPHHPVYLGPPDALHPNTALNILVPGTLVSIKIVGLPAGDTIKDGNGNEYAGGAGDITISATNYYSGLTLFGGSATPATLTIWATVDGPGGLLPNGSSANLILTVDLDSTVHWINSAGGDWNVPGNWSTGAVPIPSQDILIDAPGTYSVTSATNVSIDSLLAASGVTLNITGGTFSLTTADSQPLSNAGTIVIGAGAELDVGEAAFAPKSVVNTGTLQVNGTLNLINLGVTNSGGEIDAALGSHVNLERVTIKGGLLTGPGSFATAGIGTESKLDGGLGDPVTIDTGTVVTLNAGITLILAGTIQGGGEILVAGASTIIGNGIVLVPINAAGLADDAVLTLKGSAALTVTNLVGDLNAGAPLTGTLNVTTADNVVDNEITITTGSNTTTIIGTGGATSDIVTVHALALADDTLLTLSGAANFVVDGLKGDLNAGAPLTGTLNVTTADNVVDNEITITTGSNTTTIIGTGGATSDIVTVHALALADDTLLTLSGAANFVVDGLKGDLNAGAPLTGTLNVTTADNVVDNEITITTGSNTTTIIGTGGATSDIVTVHALALADDTLLTLSGAANFVVDGLKGDLNAGAPLTGTLNVTTADNVVDNEITITTGSNTTTIIGTGGATSDIVTVHALALADDTLLTLSGAANFVVDGLKGDLNAGTPLLTGELTVTTGNATDNLITITTGENTTTITSGAADAITVEAAALLDNELLSLAGPAAFTVNGLVGNLDAATPLLTGELTVTTGNATDNLITITTGSNTTTITSGAADAITVEAAALLDNELLSLAGPAAFTVNGLVGNLDAATPLLTGELTVTTGNATDNLITITTGSNTTTITANGAGDTIEVNAAAMLAGQALNLFGSNTAFVTLDAGNLSAGTYTGNITVTGGAGANSITTGSGTDTITGGAGIDTIHAGAGDDIIIWTVGDGNDTELNGGADSDTLQIFDTAAGDTIQVVTNGTTITGIGGDTSNVIAIETATLDAIGGGNDTLDYTGTTVVVSVNLGANTATGFTVFTGSIENVTGGSNGDILVGSSVANTIVGGAGDDQITGGGASDQLFGGADSDTFMFTVGDGQNTVDGGSAGSDVDTQEVNGTAASETFYINPITGYLGIHIGTGAANDTNYDVRTTEVEEIVINTNGGGDTVIITGDLGGTGVSQNTITVEGGAGNDTLDASGLLSEHHVEFNGGGGDDTFKSSNAGGNDTFAGGDDINGDTVDYSAVTGAGVTVNLGAGTAMDLVGGSGVGSDTLAGVENAIGTAQGDMLVGSSVANTFTGGTGGDTIYGGSISSDSGPADKAVFAGDLADYEISFDPFATPDPEGMYATVAHNTDGTDTLYGVELLEFDGVTLDLTDNVFLFDASNHLIGTFDTIQAAVEAVGEENSTIKIRDGSFAEQVVVDGNNLTNGGLLDGLTIQGNGFGTVITAPTTTLVQTADAPGTGDDLYAIIQVKNTTNVTAVDLKVDGGFAADRAGEIALTGARDFQGISFVDASGEINTVQVLNVGNDPAGLLFGPQWGTAIYVDNSAGFPKDIYIHDAYIPEFQKTGILVNNATGFGTGSGGTDDLLGSNTIDGMGATALLAQTAIQVSNSTGSLSSNNVNNIAYTPGTPLATGIRVSGDGALTLSSNTIFGADNGIDPPGVGLAGVIISDTDTVQTVSSTNVFGADYGIVAIGDTQSLGADPDISGSFFSNINVNGIWLDPYANSSTPTITASFTETGSDFADRLYGADGNDILSGGLGNDGFLGRGDDDTLNGEGGDDTFTYAVGDGQDTVDGGNNSEPGDDVDTQVVNGTGATETYNINAVSLTQLGINIEFIRDAGDARQFRDHHY